MKIYFLESYRVFDQPPKPIVPPIELDFIRRAGHDLDDKIPNTDSNFYTRFRLCI